MTTVGRKKSSYCLYEYYFTEFYVFSFTFLYFCSKKSNGDFFLSVRTVLLALAFVLPELYVSPHFLLN